MNESKSVPAAIKDICLRLLTLREHSQHELLRKVTAKGYTAEQVQSVINELALQDWQSDQRYVENYIRQRLKKGFGSLRIRYELKQQGIASELLEAFMNELALDELSLAQEVYLNKYSADINITRNEWAKRCRFLLQRGFSAELLKDLFKILQLKWQT